MSTDSTYLWLNDQQAGPFTALQLRSMWTAGTITAATLCWQEGMEEWVPVGESIEEAIAAEKQAERESAVAPVVNKKVPAASEKPERQVNVLWLTLLAAFMFFGLFIVAEYGDSHGWWNLDLLDISLGEILLLLVFLFTSVVVAAIQLAKPHGIIRSVICLALAGLLPLVYFHHSYEVKKQIASFGTPEVNRSAPVPTTHAPENSPWDGSVFQVVDYLKKSAKDPASIKCSEWTKVKPDGLNYLVGCTVRGRNSFGGNDMFFGMFLLNSEGKVLKMEQGPVSSNPARR